jgi:hypothetical protein
MPVEIGGRPDLEHHRDVPVLRCAVADDLVADPELAFGDVLEPGDHSQGGRLAGSRWADQHAELAVRDIEAHVLDGFEAVVVPLGDVLEDDAGHGFLLLGGSADVAIERAGACPASVAGVERRCRPGGSPPRVARRAAPGRLRSPVRTFSCRARALRRSWPEHPCSPSPVNSAG